MLKASDIPKEIGTSKTHFYAVRSHLMKLGYDLEPTKKGRGSWYCPEQVQLMRDLEAHYKANGCFDGFPPALIDSEDVPTNNPDLSHESGETSKGNGLVHTSPEQVPIESHSTEEIYIDTNPLEDLHDSNLNLVDKAAQHNAAQNLAAFNYLTVDYMKHRDFTVAGLTEQVQQSEQAVKQSFTNLMDTPNSTAKKMLARIS